MSALNISFNHQKAEDVASAINNAFNALENSLGNKADNEDLNTKQDKIDTNLETESQNIVGAINETNAVAKGANKAVMYDSYSALVAALNAFDEDEYKIGQNIYIRTVDVPDLWVSSVESTFVSYYYTDDEEFLQALYVFGYVQVGYYQLSRLETEKVSLSAVVKQIMLGNVSLTPDGNTINISTEGTYDPVHNPLPTLETLNERLRIYEAQENNIDNLLGDSSRIVVYEVSASHNYFILVQNVSALSTYQIRIKNNVISQRVRQNNVWSDWVDFVASDNVKTINSTSLVGSGDIELQKPLVSGENIKTINNESLLGSGNLNIGKWKLLGESEIESGTADAIPIMITENSFFTNQKYKKFKLVFEILAIDTYTNNYFLPRIYFQKGGTLGYRLFNSYGTSTGAVYKNNEIFYGQLVIERQQDINKCFTILLSPSNSGMNGNVIYGAGNNGVFENNITAAELNRIIVVNAMGTYDMAAGSKAWLYVWEE